MYSCSDLSVPAPRVYESAYLLLLCFTQDETGTCLVKLEVDDHADKASLLKVSATESRSASEHSLVTLIDDISGYGAVAFELTMA